MLQSASPLQVSLATSDADLRAAQRVRYEVFVKEMGSGGPGVDHDQQLETDRFDAIADHLLLRDLRIRSGSDVVGVYRVMTAAHAQQAGGFYTESEFDLTALTKSGRSLLELGRSCLLPAYRGSAALMALWAGLAAYVAQEKIDVLFGVASFHGTDVDGLRNALSHLHHSYLAPPHLRTVSRTPGAITWVSEDEINRKDAMRQTPALIKSYLKLGGVIGQGAYIDHAFNTTDVCMILETHGLSPERFVLYKRRSA